MELKEHSNKLSRAREVSPGCREMGIRLARSGTQGSFQTKLVLPYVIWDLERLKFKY